MRESSKLAISSSAETPLSVNLLPPRSQIHRTPLLTSTTLDKLASQVVQDVKTPDGQDVQLKLSLKAENLQRIGAFKVRTGQ